jgi:hypothetical protein
MNIIWLNIHVHVQEVNLHRGIVFIILKFRENYPKKAAPLFILFDYFFLTERAWKEFCGIDLIYLKEFEKHLSIFSQEFREVTNHFHKGRNFIILFSIFILSS